MLTSQLLQNPSLFLIRRCKASPELLSPPHRSIGILRLRRRTSRFQAYAESDSFGGLGISADDDSLEIGDTFSLVELSATKNLGPALTYRDGLEKLKAAVEEVMANPPSARSGVLRFQVVLPPSVKALNWLCGQYESSVAFPQFYLSARENHEPPVELSDMHGVSGIGAAIYFHGSMRSKKSCNLIAREKESEVRQEHKGFKEYCANIELNEFDNCSLLAAMLVWDDVLYHTLKEAFQSLKHYFDQVVRNNPSMDPYCQNIGMNCIDGKSYLAVKGFQMVYLNAESLLNRDAAAKCLQQKEQLDSYRSYFRHSTEVSFGTDEFIGARGTSCLIKESANINLLWAMLIIEECVRLGLTYFCIAPGSRSSPLAVSACGHSLTTCISCFDERSLAFHAVGYGRGSHIPAVVITSSGTAASNLLPAVVEASHDFVPLVLLTADRPPELQGVGANQAIDQVNHFGKFVRFFFNLPTPTDQISARMVLTTIDTAAFHATQAPYGPVHINCPFREPLDNSPRKWTLSCLRGLDMWMLKAEPFTKYIRMHRFSKYNGYHGEVNAILEIIESSEQGLLLIGSIHTEDEIWAALLLARHLSWPIVTDILSGLRLRRIITSLPEIEDRLLFIDNLDHALLSDSVKGWAQPDVILQIGSRFTSKRLGQFLAICSPCSYILVDKHPCRHDPSHIVTHRIQSTIIEFADVLLKACLPTRARKWCSSLKSLDMMVAQEISFQIHSECLLTEPHVAHVVGGVLRGDSSLFLGNSMVIRDMNMYGSGWVRSSTEDISLISNCDFQLHGIRVSGNRGASGIDGLLSTAIGYAVGCKKRVVFMVGDISFLHDTNGLAILCQRTRRKPMTILVINNHGGAIFSLLPIADRVEPKVLDKYFYTSHDVSVGKLCAAHSVKHLLVQTKSELEHALRRSQLEKNDCVIEVESCIAENADFHRTLSNSASQAANQAMNIIFGPISEYVHDTKFACKIHKMEYSVYKIELCAPPTSSSLNTDKNRLYREGFVLTILLDDKSVGFGEVAPIEIHKEDLLDAEEQLRFLIHIMEGSEISYLLPLLKGSFSHWFWRNLGIPPSSVFPSVRCGVEMAILNALAAREGSNLSDMLSGCGNLALNAQPGIGDITEKSEHIHISALIDSNGTPEEVAHAVSLLVAEGFTTIKLKVARRQNPIEDAAVIQEIRKTIGFHITIRVDANRRWTFEEAVQFGAHVKHLDLQYIEEPVCTQDDIIKFCKESCLPVALDETIDNLQGDALHKLKDFIHPMIVAVVIKPSVVGGFEHAATIAKWAQMHEKMVIISSAFESSLSLSAYVQFSHYIERQNATVRKIKNKELNWKTKNSECNKVIAHGLGTYRWLKEDITTEALKLCIPMDGDTIGASVKDSDYFLKHFQVNHGKIQRIYSGEQVRSYQLKVDGEDSSFSIKLQEVGADKHEKLVICLHGFLGTSEDWIPFMKAISNTARCISIDLPGHGESKMQWHINMRSKQKSNMSIQLIADIVLKLISDVTAEKVILVGYSMGARIALYMALKYNDKIDKAVIISGSAGLRDERARVIRTAQDEARARYLLSNGLQSFLETWYAGRLWRSLRDHPHFRKIVKSRAKHHDVNGLAKALTDLSIGRQMSLWEDLKLCKKPILLIAGEKDTKFKEISEQMCSEIRNDSNGEDCQNGAKCEMIVVPNCGHAVHLENPLPLINAVRKFLSK